MHPHAGAKKMHIKVTILQMMYLEDFSGCLAGRHDEELKALAERIVALKERGYKVVIYNPAINWFVFIGICVLIVGLVYFKFFVPHFDPGIYFP